MVNVQDLLTQVARRKIREITINGKPCKVKYHVGSNRFMVNIDGVPTVFTRLGLYTLLNAQAPADETQTA